MNEEVDYLLKYKEFAQNTMFSANKQIARQEKLMHGASGKEVLDVMKAIKSSLEVIAKLIGEIENERDERKETT